jgi:hypothetical protein
MFHIFSRRRGPLLVTALAVLAGFLTTMPAATATPTAQHTTPADGSQRQNDVFIRDIAGDGGLEPDPLSPIWESPDIWVCPMTSPMCAAPGFIPVVGQTNFVRVRLNNTGPGAVAGNVDVHFTSMGGSASWPVDWNAPFPPHGGFVGAVSVTVPPGMGSATATIPWTAVPGPGHFCLLARFHAPTDPTFGEGLNTALNTVNNNNIAWHNVDTVQLASGQPRILPFMLGNATDTNQLANLVITAPTGPFIGPGKLTIDLGPTLGKLWLAEGAPGVGVQPVGGTVVQIVDPKQAVIKGLPIQRGERFPTTLTFVASAPVNTTVLVDETDSQGADLGGVAYAVSTG